MVIKPSLISFETSKTWFYKLPAARFSLKKLIFLIKRFENFQKNPSKYSKNVKKIGKWGGKF